MGKQDTSWLKHAMVGPHLIACLLVGWFIGNRCLDRWLDTYPVWTVVFLFLGMVAGFVNLFRVVARINEEEKQENTDDPET